MAVNDHKRRVPAALIGRGDLARLLGVGLTTLGKMIVQGDAPPCVWIGAKQLWRPETVAAWLEQHEKPVRDPEARS